MNKKRYLIIIVLIIFIFLSLFTFANPFNNGEGEINDNRVLEEIEEDDINQNKNEEQNKTEDSEQNELEETKETVVEDNSYEVALDAVVKAEETLEKDNYESALDLVSKVTDKDKKELLEERLEEVLNSINLKELVEKLVSMVKTSESKKELDNARNYNKSNEILDKVSNLDNETLKESLQKELDDVSNLLDDTNVPTINIEDEAILNSDTIIKVEDENEVTLVLNGTEIENNYEVTDGVYELTVTDDAFNEVTITFTIDTIAPTATINYSKGELTNEDVVVTLNPSEDIKVTNNDGKLEYTFEENGEFTFEFEDIAGNKGSIVAKVDYIDKKAPEAEVMYSTKELTNENVIVTITFDEEVQTVEGWTLSSDKKELTKEFTANSEGTLEVKDLAGNKTTVDYGVTNIDKEEPKAEVTYSTKELTNENVIVTITFDEEVQTVEGWTLSSDKKELTKEFTANSEGTLEVKDLAGNKITVDYGVTNIDKVSPTATVSCSTEDFINGNVMVTIIVSEEIKEVEGWALSSNKKELTKEFTANSEGTLEVIDLVGNKTSVDYSVTNIDKSFPRIKGVENGKYYKEVTPIIEDENIESIKLNGFDFTSGTTIKLNGEFILVATDKAGNTTTVTFTVDNIAPKILVLDRLTVIRGDLIPIKPVIIDANLDKVTITLDGEDIYYKDGDQLTVPGEYVITAIDKAGNPSVTSFTMDNNGPEIYTEQEIELIPGTGITVKEDVKLSGLSLSNLIAFQEVKLKVKEDNFDPKSIIVLRKSSINLPFDYSLPTYNKIDYTYGDTITVDGEYIVLAADKALNISYAKFIIDTTKPVIHNIEAGKYYKEVEVNVEDATLSSIKLQEKVFGQYVTTNLLSNGDIITESGEYQLVATDKANNKTTVEFVVDSDVPSIEGVIKDYIYKEATPIIIDANLDKVVVTKDGNVIESKTTYTEDGLYVITVTDKAGNETVVNFEIDSDVLKVEGVTNNTYYNTAVTPSITHRGEITITLKHNNSDVTYVNGDTIIEQGKYTLTVIDEYENEEVVNFVIDKQAPTIYAESKKVPADGSFLSVEVTVEDKIGDIIDSYYKIAPTEVTHSSGRTVTLVDNKINTSKDWLGTYTLVYEITDNAGNESTKTITIEVLRADIVIVFDETNVYESIYDGENKLSTITAHLEDDENNLVTNNDGDIIFTVTDLNGNEKELKDAGKYIITANVNKETTGYQYVYSVSREYEIKPKEVNIEYSIVNDKVTTDNSYEYDQKVKTYVAKVNEIDGYKTIGEYSTSSANVGTYTLDATEDYNNSNYKLVGENTVTVTITKASLRVDFPLTASDINSDGTVTPVFKHLNILNDDVLVNIPYTIKYEKVTRNISWSGITTTYEEKNAMTEKGEYRVTVTVEGTTNYELSELGSTWTYVIF